MKKISAALLLFGAFIMMVSFSNSSRNIIDPVPKFNSKPVAGKWALDRSHSNVKFTVTHMVVSEVDGSFKIYDGSIEHTKADYSDAKISFSVDVNSINTDNENRDKHLKGDDFFNAEKFPTMKFESTSFKPLGGNKYELAGNLTIHFHGEYLYP